MRNRHNSSNKYLVLSLLSLLIFGSLFGFYGCQYFQQKGEPVAVDEKPQDRRIGVIKSLGGIRTSNQGTHLLQLDDGDTILLKSLQVNMDDEKYLGKTVEVSGILNYTTDRKQIMEVMSIDVISEQSDLMTQEISMKQYNNALMGFGINYRSDLTVDETSSNKVIFKKAVAEKTEIKAGTSESTNSLPVPDSGTQMVKEHRLTIGKQPNDGTVFDYIKALYPSLKSDSASDLMAIGISKSKIGAEGVDAYKKVGTESGQTTVTYYSGGPDSVFIIELETGNDGQTIEDQNLFYEMLGSFRPSASSELSDKESFTEQTASNDLEQDQTASKNDKNVPPVTSAEENFKQESDTKNDSSNEALASQQEPDLSTAFDQQDQPQAESSSQEVPAGFTTLQSDSFKFSMQYPTKWYYSGSAGTNANVIRHYDFGSKPLEEAPGSVSMDLVSGSVPSGSTVSINGKDLTTLTDGDTVSVFVKGSGSRVYKISGPSSQQDTLLQMASSISD